MDRRSLDLVKKFELLLVVEFNFLYSVLTLLGNKGKAHLLAKEGTLMKRLITLILAAGMVFSAASGASAIDFNAKGEWLFGFGAVNSGFVTKSNGKRTSQETSDKFAAVQRLRLQMDAVASETLSGTVMFEIGDTTWGKASDGGALGADGNIVKVKRAYIDWIVPETSLSLRMGIQGLVLPNAAGGSAIFDDDVAAIVAGYKVNDLVSVTAAWVRPYNDNWPGEGNRIPANYLDNVDIFLLSMGVNGDGWKVNPWVAYGMGGVNNLPDGKSMAAVTNGLHDMNSSYDKVVNGDWGTTGSAYGFRRNSLAYSNLVFAGLPIAYSGLDPWNFELDLNYGYSGSIGRYNIQNLQNGDIKRGKIERQGWLAKGLIEYKMDWATPGVFGWYGSGDDDNVKNGSERMATVVPTGTFTSFMGDGSRGWSIQSGANSGYDLMLSYAGTWGVGAQLKDITFLEDLTHTVRVAYWGGTNSPAMTKYLAATAFTAGEGVYLTTNDGLVEINVDSSYKIYDNLEAAVELGYIVNAVDKGTWNRGFKQSSFTKGDAYKAALIFSYAF